MAPVICVAWSPVVPLEFVCGSTDSSLCVWRVMEDEDGGNVNVCLKWGMTDRLVAIGATIGDATGLNNIQRKLLQQNGAIDKTPPMQRQRTTRKIFESLALSQSGLRYHDFFLSSDDDEEDDDEEMDGKSEGEDWRKQNYRTLHLIYLLKLNLHCAQ